MPHGEKLSCLVARKTPVLREGGPFPRTDSLATHCQFLPTLLNWSKERWFMDTMNIALPESLKQFVQERVTAGGYSSVSEYMRELIRADQKRNTEERIDALLLEGLDSGTPISVTNEYWDEKKRKLTERLGKAIRSQ
jgi:antitoxin ParD1/3/4